MQALVLYYITVINLLACLKEDIFTPYPPIGIGLFGAGTRFLISKFLITKFLTNKIPNHDFPSYKIPKLQNS